MNTRNTRFFIAIILVAIMAGLLAQPAHAATQTPNNSTFVCYDTSSSLYWSWACTQYRQINYSVNSGSVGTAIDSVYNSSGGYATYTLYDRFTQAGGCWGIQSNGQPCP